MLVSPAWVCMEGVFGLFWTDCVCLQAEMEQALLQAEKQAEREQAEAENDTISQLQLKLGQLETSTQKEKEKVGSETETGQPRASACLSVFEFKKEKSLLPDGSSKSQILELLAI